MSNFLRIENITTPGGKIKINTFDLQEDPGGRKYRLSSVLKGDQSKWDKDIKDKKYNWFYTFIYEDKKMFTVHIGLSDQFIEKLNHEDTIKLLNGLLV